MTATERLRSLLDERGVEWDCVDTYNGNKRTMWGSVERGAGILGLDVKYSAIEFQKGLRLTISDCSPEQAIEATLGRGECEARLYKPEHGVSDCTICECGEINDISANYCNRCGRRIKVVRE